MTSSTLRGVMIVGFAAATLFAQETPTTEVTTERVVFVLNNQPANSVASALSQIFKTSSQVTVNSSLIGNLVVVEAQPAELPEIIELAQQLDRPPAMVTIEATVIEFDRAAGIQLPGGTTEEVTSAVAELEKKQRLHVLDRLQLSTLSDQSAFVQVGRRVPTVTGRQQSASRKVTNAYTFEDTGVLLRFTPRVADDGSVALQFTFEKSALEASQPVRDDEEPPMSAITSKVESTVRLKRDECVVLGGLRDSPGGTKEWRLIVSAGAGTD